MRYYFENALGILLFLRPAACYLLIGLVIALYELKIRFNHVAIEAFLRNSTQKTGVLLLGGIQQVGERGTSEIRR